MMKTILHILLAPMAIFVSSLVLDTKIPLKNYIFAFVLSILFFFAMDCYAEPNFPIVEMKLNKWQVIDYQERVAYHEMCAKDAFDSAACQIWYLPDTDDREKAEYCFTTLLACVAASTPMSKVMATLIAFLGKYGLSCMDKWQYMQRLLYDAKYNYEMAEFYKEVLEKG